MLEGFREEDLEMEEEDEELVRLVVEDEVSSVVVSVADFDCLVTLDDFGAVNNWDRV